MPAVFVEPRGYESLTNGPEIQQMRHLHFTQSLEALYGGGLGISTVALHRKFLSSGIPSVLCSTYGKFPQADRESAETTHEFRRVGPHSLYFSPQMGLNASRLVGEADVVHGHGLYTAANWVFGREAGRQRKPLVYHVHGFFEPWILNRSQWKKNLVHRLFENGNFNRAQLWRALTSKEADQIRNCGIKAPIVIAPNGIHLDEYAESFDAAAPLQTPTVPELKKTGLRMLFLARVHPKKGLDLLINAWSQLRNIGRDWELVIAGPDEQGYLAQVQKMVAEAGIGDRVVFTGSVTGATKIALIHSADLFVLPSYSEGFSIGLLEAMACQVPVIATHACNFPEISTTEAGWECEAELVALRQTLETAISASELERKQRGRNGRKLVETQYTWSRTVATLTEACDQFC